MMLTCPIFGSTTGLFAAVLGKDIFSVPYYKNNKKEKIKLVMEMHAHDLHCTVRLIANVSENGRVMGTGLTRCLKTTKKKYRYKSHKKIK